jgi:hypothetical protein
MLNIRNPHAVPMFGNEPLPCVQRVDVLTPFQRDIDGPEDTRRPSAYILVQSVRFQDGLPHLFRARILQKNAARQVELPPKSVLF